MSSEPCCSVERSPLSRWSWTWGGNRYAWTSTSVVGLAAFGVMLALLFIFWETKATEPLMPLDLFRSRTFSVASSAAFAHGMTVFGALAFIPLLLQVVYGVSATSSGLRMIPLMITTVVASTVSGRVISRTGRYKAFPVAGAVCLTAGMYLFSLLNVGSAPALASLWMVLIGLGIGLVIQVVFLIAQNDAKPRHLGVATSTVSFFRSLGGVVGVAVFGMIFATRLSHYLTRLPAVVAARIGTGYDINPRQVPQPSRCDARLLRGRGLARVA